MTLRQFLKAAGGVVLAVMINASGLVFFIKYPLMLLFGAGGLALAFVPFQDRPLETWIAAFFKSIYSPTIYTFKKRPDKNWLDIDLTKVLPTNEEEDTPEEKSVKSIKKVNEFINSLPSVQREEQERKASEKEDFENIKMEDLEVEAEEKTEAQIKDERQAGPKVDEELKPVIKEEAKPAEERWSSEASMKLNLRSEKLEATGETVYGEIPMPDIPEVANILVGMVTGKDGKIIEGAIVEVEDENGNPTRVLKTNALGQFRTLSPLANGKYLIITEKEGLDFNRVGVDLGGQIVKPIKIISL